MKIFISHTKFYRFIGTGKNAAAVLPQKKTQQQSDIILQMYFSKKTTSALQKLIPTYPSG